MTIHFLKKNLSYQCMHIRGIWLSCMSHRRDPIALLNYYISMITYVPIVESHLDGDMKNYMRYA
jgi:hypothetical protein